MSYARKEKAAHWETAGYESGRRTRRAIVDAATPLFAAGGFDGTSVERIARAAGMTKGAVYAGFKRKRDLYLACMEDSLSFFREPLELTAEDPEGRLREYLTWLGGRLRDEPHARSFFLQLIREEEDDPPKVAMILDLLGAPYAQLRGVIPGGDPGASAFLIFSALLLDPDLRRYHALMTGGESHDLDATVDLLVRAFKS